MALTASLSISGLSKLCSKYARAAGIFDPMPVPVLKRILVQMQGSIARNFISQGRPARWVPLKQSTIAARRKRGAGAKILRDTGRLMQSLGPFQVIREAGRAFEFGTRVAYAAVHQFGFRGSVTQRVRRQGAGLRGTFTRKINQRIPARPFLLFQPSDASALNRILSEYIVEFDDANRVRG